MKAYLIRNDIDNTEYRLVQVLLTYENAALSGLCRSPKASEGSSPTVQNFDYLNSISLPAAPATSAESEGISDSISIDTVHTAGHYFTAAEFTSTTTSETSTSGACRIKQNSRRLTEDGLVRVDSSIGIESYHIGML